MTFQRTFHETGMNGGLALALTNDSGYIVTGQHQTAYGVCDVYVYKRDACGQLDFFKTYGTPSSTEGGRDIKQTSDGGYIITGSSSYNSTSEDMLVLKIDAIGNLQWTTLLTLISNYAYGGNSVQQTSNGGYIAAGGYFDVVSLVKLDSNGLLQWSKVLQTGTDGANTKPGETYFWKVALKENNGDEINYKGVVTIIE